MRIPNPILALALGLAIAYTAAAAISAAHAEPPTPVPSAVAASAEAAEEKPQAEQAEKEFQPPSGYEKRMRRGQEVYCRQIVPAGSRIKRSECFSEAELAAIEEAQRAFREDMRRKGLICADERCSGS